MKNKRNTRRGRAKRWRHDPTGWRRLGLDVLVCRLSGGSWALHVPSERLFRPSVGVSVVWSTKAAAMRCAERWAGMLRSVRARWSLAA